MLKKLKFFYVIIFLCGLGFTQENVKFKTDKSHFSLNFKFLNNLIVIPSLLNDSTRINFVLDTGSPFTIVTDYSHLGDFYVKQGKHITIGGLGHGYEMRAYDTRNNKLRIGKVTNPSAHLILILDSPLNLSKFLGYPVHGIIGFDIFKDYVVKINYVSKKIHFYKHDYFYNKKKRKLKKYKKVDITFHQRKPYVKVDVFSKKDTATNANMLIDTGGWDAVWWFENSLPRINLPTKNYQDTLGYGINGSITGYRSKIDKIHFGDFTFNRPTTSFPDSLSLSNAISFPERNGSIGGEVLHRFHVIMDYKNNAMFLRPNKNFNKEFHYNMAGIKIQKTFDLIPYLEVVSVRANSPAERAGIRKGDMITRINGNPLENHDLTKANKLFSSKPGKKITVTLLRDGYKILKSFRLEDPL